MRTIPITYRDYRAAEHIDAYEHIADHTEDVLAPYLEFVTGDNPFMDALPYEIREWFKLLRDPPFSVLSASHQGLMGVMGREALMTLVDPALRPAKYVAERRLLSNEIGIGTAIELRKRKIVGESFVHSAGEIQGFRNDYMDYIWLGAEPLPPLSEMMRWARYQTDMGDYYTQLTKEYELPARDWRMRKWIEEIQMTPADMKKRFIRGYIDVNTYENALIQFGFSASNAHEQRRLVYDLPDAATIWYGMMMTDQPWDRIEERVLKTGMHPDYYHEFAESVALKPDPLFITEYLHRVRGIGTRLETELLRIGTHPNYIDMYKEMAYPIPPIPDIIRMAVREVFTPEIAERFGQFEQFPEPFAFWAESKGLSPQWALNYWAAHWDLPSPQHGFSMLHRDVIDMETLNVLLKALDVMPYWRDKLVQIAYKPLTRVDVRRMFATGVLNRPEVYTAYKHLGYNPENAERMTEFTERYVEPTEKTVTKSNVLKAFKQGWLDWETAKGLLKELNVKDWAMGFYLTQIQQDQYADFLNNSIKGIKNLYSRQVIDFQEAKARLTALGLNTQRIQLLLEQWYKEDKDTPPKLWTVDQTLRFFRGGLINVSRATVELSAHKYDEEHITILLQSVG